MKTNHRSQCRLGPVFICLILAAGCANQAEQPSKTANFLESATDNLANLPKKVIEDSKESLELLSKTSEFALESTKNNITQPRRIIEDVKDTFSDTDNITALLLAGGVSIAMHGSGADKKLAENFDNHRVFRDFTDESLNVIGYPWTHLAATGFWYVISSENQDEFNKQRAWTMIKALSITGAVTMSLKAVRSNEAPNGKNWAWPSGHTASSFTVASVLDEFYGPKVGIPAYALASLVAYRMMDTGDHWASDVVFGATLGWVVGHTIAGKHKQLEIAGFKLFPSIATSNHPVMGISFVKQF